MADKGKRPAHDYLDVEKYSGRLKNRVVANSARRRNVELHQGLAISGQADEISPERTPTANIHIPSSYDCGAPRRAPRPPPVNLGPGLPPIQFIPRGDGSYIPVGPDTSNFGVYSMPPQQYDVVGASGDWTDTASDRFCTQQSSRGDYSDAFDNRDDESATDDEQYADPSGVSGTSSSRRNPSEWKLTDGIPGGPLDPSLLWGFGGHVAAFIWEGQERDVLVCHTRMERLVAWQGPEDRHVRAQIHASGLAHLPNLMFTHVNKPLISAFVERWQPETNSFHLPFGEMTITLHDVHYILGLTVFGKQLAVYDSSRDVILDWMHQHLHIDMEELKKSWRSGGVRFGAIHDACTGQEVSVDDSYVAYMMYMLGATLFVNKTADKIYGHLLSLLLDTQSIPGYAWGAGYQAGDAIFILVPERDRPIDPRPSVSGASLSGC